MLEEGGRLEVGGSLSMEALVALGPGGEVPLASGWVEAGGQRLPAPVKTTCQDCRSQLGEEDMSGLKESVR